MAKDYSGREALEALMKLVKTDLYTKVDKKSIVGSLTDLETTEDPNAILGAGAARELEDRLDEKAEELERAMNDKADELAEQIENVKGETQDTVGKPGGLAPLDESGKVDSTYLPGYVDDVVEMQWVAAPEEASESDYDHKFGNAEDPLGNWLVEVPTDDGSYETPLGSAISIESTPGVEPGTYAPGTVTTMKLTQTVDDEVPDMRVGDLSGKMDKITALTLKLKGPDDGEADTIVNVSLADLSADGKNPEDLRSEIEELINDEFEKVSPDDDTYYEFSDAQVTFNRYGIQVVFKVTLMTLNTDGTKAKTVIEFAGLRGNDVVGDTLTIGETTFEFVLNEEDISAEDNVGIVVTYNTTAEGLAEALAVAIESEEPIDNVAVDSDETWVSLEAETVGVSTTIDVKGTNAVMVQVVRFVRGKIYVDVSNNYSYRWTGSKLILITSADLVEITADDIDDMWAALSSYTGVVDDDEEDEEEEEEEDDHQDP